MSNENQKPKKRLVKKPAKEPIIKINEKILSRRIITDEDGIKKEVIRSEYTDENGKKKISVKKIKIKENPKIKSATESLHEVQSKDKQSADNTENVSKDGIKKIQRNKTKKQKIWDKYGIAIIFTVIFMFIYSIWLYIVPLGLNFNVNEISINKFVQSKFNLSFDCVSTKAYTTPTFGMGVVIRGPKFYFGNEDNKTDETLYFKAKNMTIEIQAIPYLLKTVKFNKFIIRNLNASVYQDVNGKFPYITHVQSSFNPQMKKFMVYIPDVELVNFAFKKYSDFTGEYKVDSGIDGNIKASVIKEVLQQSDRITDIMLR